MLNAKELVKAVKDAKHDSTEELGEPRTVTKLLDWDGLYRDPDTETRVSSLMQPLVLPRVSVKSSLSEAVWDEDRGQVVITRCSVSALKCLHCKNVLIISGTQEKQSWVLSYPRRLSFSWRTTASI